MSSNATVTAKAQSNRDDGVNDAVAAELRQTREMIRESVQSVRGDLEAEIASLRSDITEQIQGSMDAKHPGIASRLQRLEDSIADVDGHGMDKSIGLLENNAIADGQSRMDMVESRLGSIQRIIWTIGSSVILAIVSGLLALVMKGQ